MSSLIKKDYIFVVVVIYLMIRMMKDMEEMTK